MKGIPDPTQTYVFFDLTASEEYIHACFIKHFGASPEHIFEHNLQLWAGPVSMTNNPILGSFIEETRQGWKQLELLGKRIES